MGLSRSKFELHKLKTIHGASLQLLFENPTVGDGEAIDGLQKQSAVEGNYTTYFPFSYPKVQPAMGTYRCGQKNELQLTTNSHSVSPPSSSCLIHDFLSPIVTVFIKPSPFILLDNMAMLNAECVQQGFLSCLSMEVDLISLQLVFLLVSSVAFQLCASSQDVPNVFGRPLLVSKEGAKNIDLCPAGWIADQNKTKCFRYFRALKAWDDSETYCESYKGNLVTLKSISDLIFVHNLCNRSVAGCWVGGRMLNTSTGVGWFWAENTTRVNNSVIPAVQPSSNYASNMTNLCSVLTYGLPKLMAESCNKSHAFICMTDMGTNSSHTEKKLDHGERRKDYLVILAVVSGVILFSTSAMVIWLLAYRRNRRRKRSRKQSNSAESALVPPSWRVFSCDELRTITKNFSEGNRLPGSAKTGGTYSGILPDGSKVAVKRLKRSSYQRKKEFYSEVGRVAKLHHPSLVAVKGCCYDHGNRYIVYEFIFNGPLSRWLHHVPRGGRCLNWAMRMKIAINLAQGIAFLHDKVKPQVLHRNIYASNVLLDEEFGAHLMGVGLSKFVPWEFMREKTVMAGGTNGYLAPEFVYRNELTTKSDVYSFGVLLLEIITGRKPAQAVDSVGWQSIFEWATPLVQAHRYVELLDPLVATSSPSGVPEAGVIQKVVDLVYTCTQHVPSMRPRMSHVVHQLQQLAPPSPVL
ncbi:hypothetical protein V2J09_016205 [Rumex salicifolius]